MENSPNQFRSVEEEEAAKQFEESSESEESPETEKLKPLDAVIVLGGGLKEPLYKTNPDLEDSEGWMLPIDAKMRVIAAAQMLKEGMTREVIFTGGRNPISQEFDTTEAQKMKEYAGHLLTSAGFDPERIDQAIVLEDKASNTIENVANVCNIIDQDKERYQNLAVLSNGYHLDRAQRLLRKFGLETKGISAEEKMKDYSPKYQKMIDKFLASDEYQSRLAGERRFKAGLKDIPRYWFPQAVAVEDPDRLYAIMESIYGPALAQKLGKEAVLKSRENLQQTQRVIPPEKWGEELEK